MATNEGQQAIGGISRRSMLRGGLLAGAGLATISTASAALTGTARASTPNPQYGWYYCIYCSCMFFGNDAGVCIGYASPNGRHWAGSGQYNYGILNGLGSTAKDNPQGDWYWCPDCVCLFWGQSGSFCAGNRNPLTDAYRNHAIGGTNYDLNFGSTQAGQQQQGGWHWCTQCHNLFWPAPPLGQCVAGLADSNLSGVHVGGGTSYWLEYL
jgi:hypothetical protein